MVKNFKELIKIAVNAKPRKIAIAAANDKETISAAVESKEKGVAEPVLIGNQQWMAKLGIDLSEMEFELEKLDCRLTDFEYFHEEDPEYAAHRAVELVVSGGADILMKGNISTSRFMRNALSGGTGLRTGNLISDVEVFEDPRASQSKIMLATDGGINIRPGIKEKILIIKNAVAVAHRLGFKLPRVALLSASEKVHPDLQSSIDAVAITKICQDTDMPDCIVDGPFALDNVVDMASAKEKGIESPVAGRADILVMPNMEAGNIFGKCLQYFAGGELAHVAIGAKVPILIPSRTAKTATKLSSMALAVLMCSE